MKKNLKYILIVFVVLGLTSCKSAEKAVDNSVVESSIIVDSDFNLSITVNKGEAFNHPTFAIWVEDLEGNYLKTLFITKSYASGIFGHQMVGDSIWLNKSGESIQPAALPYWTHKKGLIDGKYIVPTPDHPYVDAFTGATPNSNFSVKNKVEKGKRFNVLLEVNQSWDWNKFWTNNKYPNSDAYKHSSQPSIIYSVEINDSVNEFYLNPIGHGDPTGETGNLFTNLSTLTTAKEIFSLLKIETINQ